MLAATMEKLEGKEKKGMHDDVFNYMLYITSYRDWDIRMMILLVLEVSMKEF